MKAVVEIAGTQYRVSEGDEVKVPLLQDELGSEVELGRVLLLNDGDDLQIGTPSLSNKVKAKVLSHGKDDKILVFHKKRRKGYQKLNGHRQRFSTVKITEITNN